MILLYTCLFLFCQVWDYDYVLAENIHSTSNDSKSFLLCRKCGTDVVDAYYLINKQSPGSQNVLRQSMFGQKNVTIQSLVNPFGIDFDIITTEKARCHHVGQAQSADSWFPGYTWRLCTCPKCGHHLGWTFEKQTSRNNHEQYPQKHNELDKFHGIILRNILDENFTDSLIMLPKAYRL